MTKKYYSEPFFSMCPLVIPLKHTADLDLTKERLYIMLKNNIHQSNRLTNQNEGKEIMTSIFMHHIT